MHLHSDGLQAQGEKLLGDPVAAQSLAAVVQATGLKPVLLTGRMFVRPNILRTLRRTMIRFLIELLVRRICFRQFNELYLAPNLSLIHI